jgi:hypothetical protein
MLKVAEAGAWKPRIDYFQLCSSAFAAKLNQAVKMYLHPITCDPTSPEGIEIGRYGFLESGVRL